MMNPIMASFPWLSLHPTWVSTSTGPDASKAGCHYLIPADLMSQTAFRCPARSVAATDASEVLVKGRAPRRNCAQADMMMQNHRQPTLGGSFIASLSMKTIGFELLCLLIGFLYLDRKIICIVGVV